MTNSEDFLDTIIRHLSYNGEISPNVNKDKNVGIIVVERVQKKYKITVEEAYAI